MDKCYFKAQHKVLVLLCLTLLAASCKKDPQTNPNPTTTGNFAKLGLYEQIGSGTQSRRIYIACSKLGDITTANYGLVFDTGSSGMTIDANGIIPASMITSDGFQMTGDSVVVSGITITSQKAVLSYGGVDGAISEYGNLAYAKVTIGDGHGNTTTPRIPFFLYYKVINLVTNAQLPVHSADVFGVAPGINTPNLRIMSPLSYFNLPGNLTNGFRLAQLNPSNFLATTTYTADLLYIGLTPGDLSSSNFVMHPLTYSALTEYSPNIASSITYNGKTVQGTILFDTGTPLTTIVEDPTAADNSAALPANSTVSITTGQGFSYQYTTTSTFNLTEVENPSYSKDNRTVFSIDFFLNNEFLIDYTNNRIGLKNN